VDKKLKTYYFLLNEKEYKKYKTLIKKRHKKEKTKRLTLKLNVKVSENPINKEKVYVDNYLVVGQLSFIHSSIFSIFYYISGCVHCK
jgi:hypothetical protein